MSLETKPLKVLDLFSGIGGFAIASELVGGFETAAFCEINPYCQKVLSLRYPNVPVFEDVRNITAQSLDHAGIPKIDAIFGGFPCQDISNAGKQKGLEGDRSSLFFEIVRLICALTPRIVVLENVAALLGRGLDRVLRELAQIGYDAEWCTVAASEVGACHRRDRIWIIAWPSASNTKGDRWRTPRDNNSQSRTNLTSVCCGNAANSCHKRPEGREKA
jgi:DNA (cytosine-5)-methyltransferase 1